MIYYSRTSISSDDSTFLDALEAALPDINDSHLYHGSGARNEITRSPNMESVDTLSWSLFFNTEESRTNFSESLNSVPGFFHTGTAGNKLYETDCRHDEAESQPDIPTTIKVLV